MAEPNNTPLTKDEVRKVAKLCRLTPTEEELAQQQARLAVVLGFVGTLSELDLQGVEPMTGPGDTVNRMDEDTPREGMKTEQLLSIAPDSHGPFIRTPKALGDGGG